MKRTQSFGGTCVLNCNNAYNDGSLGGFFILHCTRKTLSTPFKLHCFRNTKTTYFCPCTRLSSSLLFKFSRLPLFKHGSNFSSICCLNLSICNILFNFCCCFSSLCLYPCNHLNSNQPLLNKKKNVK